MQGKKFKQKKGKEVRGGGFTHTPVFLGGGGGVFRTVNKLYSFPFCIFTEQTPNSTRK